ncbi:hypothetical protein KHA80_08175 [Anaerobacillus sp. HL2]|nr:hypothetical protein KHA80_08175 [Anaerobacillus sp. HL2]
MYVTNVVGWDGIKKIELKEDGTKDFTEIINKALELADIKKVRKRRKFLLDLATMKHYHMLKQS